MKISLVLCTRNREAQLRASLESLLKQDCCVPWELIIVDNGSIDETQKTIEEFRGLIPCMLTAVVEPQPGLGRARNRGWRIAQGEIIAFTDDDCYPDPYFLNHVLQCFDEDSRLGFVGGRILLHDPTDFHITVQEHQARVDIKPTEFILAGLIQGANFSFRKTALESVDGFDNVLGAGAWFPCEDVDILARMTAAGWYGAYDPRPLVYHHHRRKTATEASSLMKQYDRGRGAYYAKCLLNSKLCRKALQFWYWRIRYHQPWTVTAREIKAAIEYYARLCIARVILRSSNIV